MRGGTDGRTFSVLEVDDVDAGVVGSVVADVAEVGTSVGEWDEDGEREGADGIPGSAGLEDLAHRTGHRGDVGGGVVLVAHLDGGGRGAPALVFLYDTKKGPLLLPLRVGAFHLPPPSTMGKSQSKLSPDQLADLQKNTYCKPSPANPAPLIRPQSTSENYSNGPCVPARCTRPL